MWKKKETRFWYFKSIPYLVELLFLFSRKFMLVLNAFRYTIDCKWLQYYAKIRTVDCKLLFYVLLTIFKSDHHNLIEERTLVNTQLQNGSRAMTINETKEWIRQSILEEVIVVKGNVLRISIIGNSICRDIHGRKNLWVVSPAPLLSLSSARLSPKLKRIDFH